MAEGKFSRPRTQNREEQEIDLAFEQLTGRPVTVPPEAPRPVRKPTKETESPTISRNRMITAIALCALGLMILIGVIVGIVAMGRSGADDGKILNNVTVVGVNIGGLTPQQAEEAVRRVTDLTYSREDMVIRLPDGEFRLTPAETGAALDVAALVQAAYDYGRSGTPAENKLAYNQSLTGAHTISALPYLTLDRDFIRQSLETWFAELNGSYTPASYTLEGEAPKLNGADFDEKAPCQTLVLYTGTPGRHVNTQKLYNDILDAYSFNIFLVEVVPGETGEEPEALDLDAIFEELHQEPVDAVMDPGTFEVTEETYGYTFDLDKAKRMLSHLSYGEELRVEMKYITPEVLREDLEELLYRDMLGSCETSFQKNTERDANLKLAVKALNGLVIDPGEEFSFNETLRDQTGSDSYKNALCSAHDEETQLGGGICQVATALYRCVLLGDLRVTERNAHSHQPDFGDPGMDAMVNGGNKDFCFLNTTSYPIRIEAEISGGRIQIRLLGTDEKDYFIRLEHKVDSTTSFKTRTEEYEEDNSDGYKEGDVVISGLKGSTVSTYRCKFSKDTGKQTTKDLIDTTVYKSRDEVVAKILPKPTTEPSEETTEPTETSEPTEAAEESTAPTE